MSDEAAAVARGGPQGPADVRRRIIARLSDLEDRIGDPRRGQDTPGARIEALDAKAESARGGLDPGSSPRAEALDAKAESVRTGSVGLLLLAAVGLLVKPFFPAP